MAYSLSPWLKPRFFITGTNRPLAGGLMYTYKAGTTDPAKTYSDDAGTENTNPILLDTDGQCDLFLDDDVSYRIILKNALGVTQFDKDRIASIGNTQVQSFNSIAALRLKTGTATSNSARTLGYYVAGDGGGNNFYYDTTSTATGNNGTIIKPTAVIGAGRWLAVDSVNVNTSQFGCTGAINDNSAFGYAIVYAQSANIKLTIDKPIVILGSEWTPITLTNHLSIIGTNANSTITVSGTQVNLFVLAATKDFKIDGVIFSNLATLFSTGASNYGTIELNKVKVSNSKSVCVTGANDITLFKLKDCIFDTFTGSASYVFGMAAYFKSAVIEGCRFTNLNSTTSSMTALYLGKTQLSDQLLTGNYIITDNYFYNINADGNAAGEVHAIQLYGDTAVISNNIIKSLDRVNGRQLGGVEGIYTKTINTTITGNVLVNAGFAEGNKGAQINVKGVQSISAGVKPLGINTIVSNNAIYATDTENRNGIRVESDYTIISNNIVSNHTSPNPIGVAWAEGATAENILITGNVVTKCTFTGAMIWLNVTGKRIVVTNNLLSGIGTGGSANGILMLDANRTTDTDNLIIDGNVIEGTDITNGIFVWLTVVNVLNMTIKDNKITNDSGSVNGIRMNTTRILSGEVVNNIMKGVTYPYSNKAIDTCRFYGNTNNYANIDMLAAAPTTGTWARGEYVYNSAPAASGNVGWICVTAGTPGTWKTWGTIGA